MRINAITGSLLVALATATGAQAQQGAWFEFSPGFFSAMRSPDSDSFLGVYLAEVGPETVQQLELEEEYGAHVSEVIDDSPAAAAGLQADDVIIGWNESRVESSRQLKRLVAETPPGRKVQLDVTREGDTRAVEVEIGRHGAGDDPHGRHAPHIPWQHPQIDDDWSPAPPPWQGPKPRLGVLLQGLTEQLGAYFGLGEDQSGVLIVEVLEDSVAEEIGLQAGDVIIEIAGVQIESPTGVQRLVAEQSGKTHIKILRQREEQTIDVTFPQGEPEVRERVIPEDDEEAEEEEDEEDEPRYPGSAM